MPKIPSLLTLFFPNVVSSRFSLHRVGGNLVVILLLCGCGSWTNTGLNPSPFRLSANATPIKQIQKPQSQEVTVYIQGKVEKIAPLMQRRAYQINDGTGKIWVISQQKNLQIGQEAVFKGKVKYQSIPLAGQDYGEVYLAE